MIQAIVAGVWAITVFAAANMFAPGLLGTDKSNQEIAGEVELMSVTVQSNVPTIKDGKIRGFIISNLIIQLDKAAVDGDAKKVKQYVKHEVLDAIYGAQSDAFVKPRKEDLQQFTATLLSSVEKRVGNGAVRELLVQEMYFVPLNFLRGRRFNKFAAGQLGK